MKSNDSAIGSHKVGDPQHAYLFWY